MVHPWQTAQGMLATPHPGRHRLFALVAGEAVSIRELALRMRFTCATFVSTFTFALKTWPRRFGRPAPIFWGEGEAQVEEDRQIRRDPAGSRFARRVDDVTAARGGRDRPRARRQS
jgi:hypothetical protein